MKAVIPAVWSAAIHPPDIPGTKSPETKHLLNQIQAQLTLGEGAAPDILPSFCVPLRSELPNQRKQTGQEEPSQHRQVGCLVTQSSPAARWAAANAGACSL